MVEVKAKSWLSVGEVAARSGLAVSALHFYERKRLIHSVRTAGNQRRYGRDVLRRVAVIQTAQRLGIPLAEIAAALAALPAARTPSQEDWAALARDWAVKLDRRIAELVRLRDQLASCIGCGCLSIDRCALHNPNDRVAARGAGPVFLRETEATLLRRPRSRPGPA